MRNTLFLTLPAVLVIGIMRVPIVRLLLQGGKFGPEDTLAVGQVLLWLTPGMLALAIVYILTRAFYARHDAMTPVLAGVASVVACVAALPLMRFGLPGLGMATSLSGIINVAILLVLLKHRVGLLDGRRILLSLARTLPANLFLAGACGLLPPLVDSYAGTGGLGRLLAVVVPLAVGLGGFLALATLFQAEELHTALRMVTRRGRGAAAERE